MNSIKWEIEPLCNLSCKHCIVKNIHYPESVSFYEKINIVDQLKSKGYNHIIFSTKEPLLDENLFNIIKYNSSNNIYSSIITNGLILNEKIIGKLNEYKIKNLAISLEGWTKEDNDFIRGKGVFSVVDNILSYLDQMEERKFDVVIQLNLNKVNIQNVESFIPYFSKYHNFVIEISEILPFGSAKSLSDICCDPIDYFQFAYYILNHIEKNNIYIFEKLNVFMILLLNSLGLLNRTPTPPSCGIYKGSFSILNNGSMCRCLLLEEVKEEIPFQNRLKTTLIESSELKENIENYHIKECNGCEYFTKCQICYLYHTSNYEKKYVENCLLFKNLRKEMLKKILENRVRFKISEHIEQGEFGKVIRKYDDSNVIINNPKIYRTISNMNIKLYNFYSESNLSEDIIDLMYKNDLIEIEKGGGLNELLSNF